MWIQVSLCNFSNIQMLYSAGPQNEIKQRLNHPMRGYKSWWCRTFQIHFENARYELGFADCMRKIVSSSCEVSPQADPLAIYMPRSLVFLLVAHFEISPPLMHGKLIRLSVNIFFNFFGRQWSPLYFIRQLPAESNCCRQGESGCTWFAAACVTCGRGGEISVGY